MNRYSELIGWLYTDTYTKTLFHPHKDVLWAFFRK